MTYREHRKMAGSPSRSDAAPILWPSVLLLGLAVLLAGCASTWSPSTTAPGIVLQWPFQPHPPKLTYLRLAETAVSDQGLAEIAKIVSLEELDLELLRISDKGLLSLRGLKNLKKLNIAMVGVSDDAVAALQSAIRGLDVRRWRIPGG